MADLRVNKRESKTTPTVKVDNIDVKLSEKSVEKTSKRISNNTDNLDVPLSTRASEATLLEVKDAVSFKNKLLQVDTVGSTTYIGYAVPGTLTSAATWSIKKIVETANDVSITWADGSDSFDNIWDDRLILTYS